MTAVVLDQLAYRPAQAAELLGLSVRQVYKLIHSGELRSMKIGTARLIRREWLIDWLDGLEASS